MNGTRSPEGQSSPLPYRPCVGIMLINPKGMIWIGRRRHIHQNIDRSESWQMPQGGIDEAEDPAAAALRELAEETGTGKAEILGETRSWLHYDFPPELIGVVLKGRYCGQKQKWFAMRFLGTDADFNIHNPVGGHDPEFDDWRWSAADDLLGMIVPFKRKVYEEVIEEFRPFLRSNS